VLECAGVLQVVVSFCLLQLVGKSLLRQRTDTHHGHEQASPGSRGVAKEVESVLEILDLVRDLLDPGQGGFEDQLDGDHPAARTQLLCMVLFQVQATVTCVLCLCWWLGFVA
jgi:hypothetical protein